MIEILNLSKCYQNHLGRNCVLRNINLVFPTGVSVGLIGPNGAGKSTLLNLIAGIDVPDQGKIVRNCNVSWPIGLAGGFQPSLTGRQNVKFVAKVHGCDDSKPIVDFVEDFAEIGPAFDEPMKTYSAGMRSRLTFGMSLAFDFDVYLSDEATAVGDAKFKQKAKQVFQDRVGKASIIMVSHAEGILKQFCQAGVVIQNKSAFWFDDIHEALAFYKRDV